MGLCVGKDKFGLISMFPILFKLAHVKGGGGQPWPWLRLGHIPPAGNLTVVLKMTGGKITRCIGRGPVFDQDHLGFIQISISISIMRLKKVYHNKTQLCLNQRLLWRQIGFRYIDGWELHLSCRYFAFLVARPENVDDQDKLSQNIMLI